MPGSEIQAEIVQTAASFHDPIPEFIFPDAQLVFNNSIAFDATDGVFDPDAQARYSAVALFLFGSEFFATWFFHGLDHSHVSQSIALKTSVLSQATPLRQNQACFICDFLVVLLAFASWGEQNDLGLLIDQHIVLDAMTFLLTAVESVSDFWVFGPLDRPFCAILKEKLPFFK